MQGRIIDCCSLINLVTGWQGLDELTSLGIQSHICDAVVQESEFTRDYDDKGQPKLVPLNIGKMTESGLLLRVYPETTLEQQDYLEFAYEVDDGEAQALAIAKHRGLILITDDRKAISLAQRKGIQVKTESTIQILQTWAALAPNNVKKLPKIISRIEVLARFRPPPNTKDFAWWNKNR